MKILVLNSGSSSLKYQLFSMTNEKTLAKGICERIGSKGGKIKHTSNCDKKVTFDVDMPTHIDALKQVMQLLSKGEYAVIDDLGEISAVGHRMVNGGWVFNKAVLIDDEVLKKLEEIYELAPLHNPASVMGMKSCREVLGKDVPQVVVFDTAFHHTMPPEAYMFPIPYEYYEKYKIRKYGFHGTSHRYVSEECAKKMGKSISELKIITVHLGNGSSIAAVKYGKCVDTTMGFTPLDGLIMGTRSGSIDPSVVFYLFDKENLSPKQVSDILNKKSGKAGIANISDDRDLREAEKAGDKRAALALRIQNYQVTKYIGSYAAAMNGVDAIAFAGGIGENSDSLRREVCDSLTFMGIELDYEKNEQTLYGKEGEITKPGSKVKVFVIPTNEELVIARDTLQIVKNLK